MFVVWCVVRAGVGAGELGKTPRPLSFTRTKKINQNKTQGTLPMTMGNMRSLYAFTASNNQLTGES